MSWFICLEIYVFVLECLNVGCLRLEWELTGGWHGFFMPDAFRGLFGLLSDIVLNKARLKPRPSGEGATKESSGHS